MNAEDKDRNIIINLIPPAYPTCTKYKNDDGTIGYSPISYIAVTRSGDLRPVDGDWTFADDASNYVGIAEFHKEPSWMTRDEFMAQHGFGFIYEY